VRAARLTAAGDVLQVTWDSLTCPATGYNLIHGGLNGVAGYALSGAVCDLGTTGTLTWTAVPAGDLYFLILGADGSGTESSWGHDSAGQERNGPGPSSYCSVTSKDLTRSCP
jgi:hypothetical protein